MDSSTNDIVCAHVRIAYVSNNNRAGKTFVLPLSPCQGTLVPTSKGHCEICKSLWGTVRSGRCEWKILFFQGSGRILSGTVCIILRAMISCSSLESNGGLNFLQDDGKKKKTLISGKMNNLIDWTHCCYTH